MIRCLEYSVVSSMELGGSMLITRLLGISDAGQTRQSMQ